MGTCGMLHSLIPECCLAVMFAHSLGGERVHWCALCDACVGAPAPMTVTSPRHWGDVSVHTTHALSSCNLGSTHWPIAARPLVIHGWRRGQVVATLYGTCVFENFFQIFTLWLGLLFCTEFYYPALLT